MFNIVPQYLRRRLRCNNTNNNKIIITTCIQMYTLRGFSIEQLDFYGKSSLLVCPVLCDTVSDTVVLEMQISIALKYLICYTMGISVLKHFNFFVPILSISVY